MSKKKYADFFSRLDDLGNIQNEYDQLIREPKGKDYQRSNRLFGECFGHHVSPHVPPEDDKLRLDVRGNRWITKDQLTSRFIHQYYEPPSIYETSESNLEELIESEEIEPIGFERFVNLITDDPITNELEGGYHAGTNRVSFLLGNIGRGKSVFATKLYCHLRTKLFDRLKQSSADKSDWIVVPVYFDIGSEYVDYHTGEIRDIDDQKFFTKLYEFIAAGVTRGPLLQKRCQFHDFVPNDINSKLNLIELIAHMVARKIRLVIVLDNLDQYHFQFKKWAFIDEYALTQDKSVKDNIGGLVSIFDNQLDNPGLCVLFICRYYVYQHLRMVSNTIIPRNDSAVVYQLEPVTSIKIVNSRNDLYSEARPLVQLSKRDSSPGDTWAAVLEVIRGTSISDKEDDSPTPIFEMLKRLSHHGHRGFVEFLSGLKIYDEDDNLKRRFFEKNQAVLLILYITKQRKLYTQDNEHFPNMFLNDLFIRADSDFPLAIANHAHSYWLKYLILKYVVTKNRVSSKEVIVYFMDLGYEEVLIRVVIGSLSTSEFYCLQVDNESHNHDRQRWLVPTDRGAALVSKDFGLSSSSKSCEFCFSFVYLQLVVEDRLLALPKKLLAHMEPKGDYSYIYLSDSSYGRKAKPVIENRAKASMWFLKILTASLNIEILADEKRRSSLAKLLPDLQAAKLSLINEIEALGRAIDGNVMAFELRNETETFRDDVQQLEEFFQNYYASDVSVS